MAISPFKTFSPGEILTASDLNSSFTQITNNGQAVGFPRTSNADFDGNVLVLDSDGDSSITVDTDDRMDVALQGVDAFRFDGTTASIVNGLDFVASVTTAAPGIAAQGSDTNIGLYLQPKGTGNIEATAGGSETDILLTAAGSEANVSLSLRGKGSSTLLLGDADLQWPDADGTSGQLLQTNGSAALSFVANTGLATNDRLLFQQTTPSSTFTKDTGIQDDTAIRLTTGTAGSDLTGQVFTTAFATGRTTGNNSVGHTHVTTVNTGSFSLTGGGSVVVTSVDDPTQGESATHTHTLNMEVDYYDVVIGEIT